jgi:hypothetical protein
MATPDDTARADTRPPSRVSYTYFFTTAGLMRCRAIRAPD